MRTSESTESSQSILSISSFRPLIALLFLLALPAFGDVTLNVTTSRPRIYLGETFNLTVEVSGADRGIDSPNLSAVTNAEVQFLGQNSNSRSSISIINGHMTREVYEGRVFAYQIKPLRDGTFKTGPIQVSASGKTYTHPGVTVEIAGVEKQDTVIAAVTASSATVLVEEPFTITLAVAIAELPDPYAESYEPIHPNLQPQISADFLEIKQSTPGLKGPDLNQILNGLIDQSGRKPAFAINSYQTRDMGGFGSFFDGDPFRPRPIRFRLEPTRITVDGKKFRQYALSLSYTPTKEGEFTFGPLSFKGAVIAGVSPDRQPLNRDIYTIGPAVTVRVVPPPDEGRPDWFTGSVGKSMKAAASFDASVCKVGDPLTLTLDLNGPISISNLRTPILNLQPELTHDFRIYDDNVTAETLPDGKRFKYRVRPTRAGTLEFPPIKVAYYDTASKAYVTVTTTPIPIQALATTQIATATDTGKPETASPLDTPTRPLPAGLTLSSHGTQSDSLLPPPRVTQSLLLGAPLLCLLSLLVAPFRRSVAGWRSRRRRSGALHRARAALRHATTPDLAARAARTYLADRLSVSGNALTPFETATLLRQRNVSEGTAESWRALLAQLDEAMYKPGAENAASELIRSLQTLLPQLDAELGHSDRPARSAMPLTVILFALSLPVLADDSSRSFLWEQANAQAASAAKPEAYIKAANTYNRLVTDGVCNGALLVNLGNTLVMAGDGANAAAAFARAERYQGASPETRQGLAAAAELQNGHSQAELPWSRTAFFWHYALPCSMRALAALAGWTLFWFGVLVRILLKRSSAHTFLRSLSETCMLTGGLLATAFAASTFLTLAHERHDSSTWGSRIFISSAPSELEDAP